MKKGTCTVCGEVVYRNNHLNGFVHCRLRQYFRNQLNGGVASLPSPVAINSDDKSEVVAQAPAENNNLTDNSKKEELNLQKAKTPLSSEAELFDAELEKQEVDVSLYDFQCSNCKTYAFISDIEEKGVCPNCGEAIN